jgi:NAD+ diphosphatase
VPPRYPGQLTALPLARATLDRAADRRGDDLLPTLLADPATRVLEVASGRARVSGNPPALVLRAPEPSDAHRVAVFLGHEVDGTEVDGSTEVDGIKVDGTEVDGTNPGVNHVAVAVDGPQASNGAPVRFDVGADADGWAGLREVGGLLGARDAGLLTEATAVLNGHATHPRCPRCGEPTVVVMSGWSRHCPADGSDHYPRTDPAVIMTVVDDDDRLLLGSQAAWPTGRFSTLAGFVEPGEPLEAAVRREVVEEVGVRVGEVTYLGSQPWPFPASVMVGFRARAITTEVRVDGLEIAQARWFTREELTTAVASGEVVLPSRVSIARALVEEWYGGPIEDDGGTWR